MTGLLGSFWKAAEREPPPVVLLAFANDASNPLDNLDTERQAIRKALRSLHSIKLEVEAGAGIDRLFGRFDQCTDRLLIFHYGGHANGTELDLETPRGPNEMAYAGGLAKRLGLFNELRLVFLNACATQGQVKALQDAGVQAIIATARPINDKMATDFAKEFYRSLAGGQSVGKAFKAAQAIISTRYGNEKKVEHARSISFGDEDAEPPVAVELNWILYTKAGDDTILDWKLPNAQPLPVNGRRLFASAVAALAAINIAGWALKPASATASGKIAVLPFENLSGDPRQAYLADDISKQVRRSLGRFDGLMVIGQTSLEKVDARAAPKWLQGANILTGSLRQSPSGIRVHAELIDASSGTHVWSTDYDHAPGNAVEIESEIAEKVASSMGAAQRIARSVVGVGGTSNAEAQRLFFEAQAEPNTTPAGDKRARGLLEKAIGLDSSYAAAYALQSLVFTHFADNYAQSEDVERYRAASYALAKRALVIAPDLAEAHVALSSVYQDEYQFADELREFKLAAKLAPGDATVQAQYSNAMRRIGNNGEALRLSAEAIKLDPLNSATRLLALFSAGRYKSAVDYARRLPFEKPAPGIVGDCLLLLGRFQEAEQSYGTLPADHWHRLTGEAILALRRNDRAAAVIKLAALKKSQGDAGSLQYAEIYAQMGEKGDKDRAFGALNRGFEVKDSGLTTLKIDPFLEPLRSDPRFAALVKKMDFPSSLSPFYETWVKFLVPWPALPEGDDHE